MVGVGTVTYTGLLFSDLIQQPSIRLYFIIPGFLHASDFLAFKDTYAFLGDCVRILDRSTKL